MDYRIYIKGKLEIQKLIACKTALTIVYGTVHIQKELVLLKIINQPMAF